jgi:hypothetical protein
MVFEIKGHICVDLSVCRRIELVFLFLLGL